MFHTLGGFSLSLLDSFNAEGSQLGVLVHFYHFRDDLIVGAVQVRIIVILLRVVTALLNDPLLLAIIQITLKVRVVLANDTLYRVKVAISDVVSSFRDASQTFDVIGQKSEALGTQSSFANLSVELAVLVRAIDPTLVNLFVFFNFGNF
jgi:hypothetical protein